MFEKFPYQFGPYQLMGKIGQGGMAEIFRAEHQGTQGFVKEVAIKRILASLASNEDFVTQFLDEARIAGSLSHSNIVQIFDVGQVEDAYYIAMEYVNGKHLGQVIRTSIEQKELVPIQVAVSIAKDVAQALGFAHSALDVQGKPLNIIHRDVSPQNILVDFYGSVKLTDFGIAKAANKLFQTTAGIIKGKFSYLAPEQLVGKPASPSSDLFSLGVVFWEMLSGRRLFQGESDIKTIQLVQACQVPPVGNYRSDIPPKLEEILTNLLAPSPQYRYQDAKILVQDLSYFLNEHGFSEGPAQISNFMGSLYKSELPNSQNPPTKAIPSFSSDALHSLETNTSPPQSDFVGIEEFEDAPTPTASELTAPGQNAWETASSGKQITTEENGFDALQTAAVDMSSLVTSSEFQLEEPLSSYIPEETQKVKEEEPSQDSPFATSQETKHPSNKSFRIIVVLLLLMLGGLGGYFFYAQQKQQTARHLISLPKKHLVTLEVFVTPPQAKVTLNGYLITGKNGKRIQRGLSGGVRYRIKATHENYRSFKRAILLSKPTEIVRIHLKKMKQ